VRQRVWEAFAAETGVGQGMASTTGPVATIPDPNTLSLEQVEQFGLALITLARQQLAFQEQHAHEMIEVRGSLSIQEQRLDVHDERLTAQDERLNRAAEVVGATVREVKALKARLDPGNVITDEQAAELQNLVKTVAHELTRQSTAGGKHRPIITPPLRRASSALPRVELQEPEDRAVRGGVGMVAGVWPYTGTGGST
jgi:hypothetical protein